MKNLFLVGLSLVVLISCKSKVCECADIHIKAVKEINGVSDPVKKMKVLSSKKYQGPFDWDYHGKLTSYAGAQGPMQIITRWAHQYAERRITEKELRTNIDLNVMISMKMLRTRYNSTGNWATACGGYNTGSAIVNDYARYCVSNKNYKSKWVSY